MYTFMYHIQLMLVPLNWFIHQLSWNPNSMKNVPLDWKVIFLSVLHSENKSPCMAPNYHCNQCFSNKGLNLTNPTNINVRTSPKHDRVIPSLRSWFFAKKRWIAPSRSERSYCPQRCSSQGNMEREVDWCSVSSTAGAEGKALNLPLHLCSPPVVMSFE